MYKGYKLTKSTSGKDVITAASGMSGVHIQTNTKASSVIESFVSGKETELRKVYRDIYYHDSIGGAAVDLISDLTFSEFELTDVPDDVRDIYKKKLANFNFATFLPELSLDYHVFGAFCGSLSFNSDNKSFSGIVPHSLDDCKFTEVPLYGSDPLIDLKPSKALKEAFASSDVRMKAMMANAPSSLRNLRNGAVALDPATTLFISRRNMASDNSIVSYYRRILPYYLLETSILKGSITQARQRQRAILMLTCGNDEWEASAADLRDITEMFISANADPLGAVVALRQGVEAQEVMQGGDFWKIDDIYDSMSTMKMRALGMNEAMLTGDGTWSNTEQAVESFLMYLESHRATVCRKVFYDKIFPLISITNDLEKKETITSCATSPYSQDHVDVASIRASLGCSTKVELKAALESVDYSRYWIPKVSWSKPLSPTSDSEFMDRLTALADQDIPVPLRMFAQASGVDLDGILTGLQDDLEDRKRINAYNEAISGDDGGSKGSDDSDDGWEGSSLRLKKVGLGNRNFRPLDKDKAMKENKELAAALKSVNDKRIKQAQQDTSKRKRTYNI